MEFENLSRQHPTVYLICNDYLDSTFKISRMGRAVCVALFLDLNFFPPRAACLPRNAWGPGLAGFPFYRL